MASNRYISISFESDVLQKTFEETLAGAYRLNLDCGQDKAGKELREERRWTKEDLDKIKNFLHRFRHELNGIEASFNGIPKIFKDFLRIDGICGEEDSGDWHSQITFFADEKSWPLLFNVPWEAAAISDKFSHDSDKDKFFSATFASRPVAKVIKGTTTSTRITEKGPLRLLYCISDPGLQIRGHKYYKILSSTFETRKSFITPEPIVGQARIDDDNSVFDPTFKELLAAINNFKPHVFILASHGDSKKGLPTVEFVDRQNTLAWEKVDEIAKELADAGNTLAVVISACDLTFQEYGPTSSSGALCFLEKGIPAVIAMQSDIFVRAGNICVDALLSHFYSPVPKFKSDRTTTLAQSLCWARQQIARDKNIRLNDDLDWALPSLFMTADADARLAELSSFIDTYQAVLELLKNRLPPIRYNFPRPELESAVRKLLLSKESGALIIDGPVRSGKSQLIVSVCKDLIDKVIANRAVPFRPFLYVDMDRLGILNDETSLVNHINDSISGSASTDSSLSLFVKIRPGKSSTEEFDTLIEGLKKQGDKIIILDNIDGPKWNFLQNLFHKARQSLTGCLVIFVVRTGVMTNARVSIKNFSRDECASFCDSNGLISETVNYFDVTGGSPFLLDQLKEGTPIGALDNPGQAVLKVAHKVLKQKHPEEVNKILDGLLALVYIPSGVNQQLSQWFLVEWDKLMLLESQSVIIRTSNLAEGKLGLPGYLTEYLKKDERCRKAAVKLLGAFSKKTNKDLELVLDVIGGFSFMFDIFSILLDKSVTDTIDLDIVEAARSFPIRANKYLYQHGRWMESFQLWRAFINNFQDDKLFASDYLLFGKTAIIIGQLQATKECVDKVQPMKLEEIEKIDLLNLEASLLKDEGTGASKEIIESKYQQIISIINDMPDKNEPEVMERKALAHYNRAIFMHWWRHDLDATNTDLLEAILIYTTLNDKWMLNVIKSERADMNLDKGSNDKGLEQIFLSVFDYFKFENKTGDLALTHYRLGRLFKRKDPIDETTKTRYLTKASDNYKDAYDLAVGIGNKLLAAIAIKHFAVIQLFFLKDEDRDEMIVRLDDAIKTLEEFRAQNDSWAARVLRDAFWFRYKYSDDAKKLDSLKDSFKISVTAPLIANAGTDLGRACAIVVDLISELNVRKEYKYMDKLFLDNKKWFENRNVNSPEDFYDETIMIEISNKSIKPDTYYGKSTR